MLMETALRKARAGEFEFVQDARYGMNEVKYQTPSGEWRTKRVDINYPQQKKAAEKENQVVIETLNIGGKYIDYLSIYNGKKTLLATARVTDSEKKRIADRLNELTF